MLQNSKTGRLVRVFVRGSCKNPTKKNSYMVIDYLKLDQTRVEN